MNIVVGFGTTETEFEAAEEDAFDSFVTKLYRERSPNYFTDELVKEVEAWAKSRTDELRAASKRNDMAADFQNRYSYYFANVISGASDIVLIAKFMHINRRHALSPDGWALMKNKRLFHISSVDIRD